MGLRNYREDKTGLFGRPIKATRADLGLESERYGKAVAIPPITRASGKRTEITAERSPAAQQIESLKPWENFDVPLDLRGTALTELNLGVLPPSADIDVISAEIASEIDSEFALIPVSREPGGVYVSLITMKDGGLAVADELTRRGFARLEFTSLLSEVGAGDGASNLPSFISDRAKASLDALVNRDYPTNSKLSPLIAARWSLRMTRR